MSNSILVLTREQIQLLGVENPPALLCFFPGARPECFSMEVAYLNDRFLRQSVYSKISVLGEDRTYLMLVYLRAFGNESATSRALLDLIFTRVVVRTHAGMMRLDDLEGVLGQYAEISDAFWDEYLQLLSEGFPNQLPMSFEKKKWLLKNYDAVMGRKSVPREVLMDLNDDLSLEERNQLSKKMTRREETIAWKTSQSAVTINMIIDMFLRRERPSRPDQLFNDIYAADLDVTLYFEECITIPLSLRNVDSQKLWDQYHNVGRPEALAQIKSIIQSLDTSLQKQAVEIQKAITDSISGKDDEMDELVLSMSAMGYPNDIIKAVMNKYYREKYCVKMNTVPWSAKIPAVFRGNFSMPGLQLQSVGVVSDLVPFEAIAEDNHKMEHLVVVPNNFLHGCFVSNSPNLPMGKMDPALFHVRVLWKSDCTSLVRFRFPYPGTWCLLFANRELDLANVLLLRNQSTHASYIGMMVPSEDNFPGESIGSYFLREKWWKINDCGRGAGGYEMQFLKKKFRTNALKAAELVEDEEWFRSLMDPLPNLYSSSGLVRCCAYDLHNNNRSAKVEVNYYTRYGNMQVVGKRDPVAGLWETRPEAMPGMSKVVIACFLSWFTKLPDPGFLPMMVMRLRRYSLMLTGYLFAYSKSDGKKIYKGAWNKFFKKSATELIVASLIDFKMKVWGLERRKEECWDENDM